MAVALVVAALIIAALAVALVVAALTISILAIALIIAALAVGRLAESLAIALIIAALAVGRLAESLAIALIIAGLVVGLLGIALLPVAAVGGVGLGEVAVIGPLLRSLLGSLLVGAGLLLGRAGIGRASAEDGASSCGDGGACEHAGRRALQDIAEAWLLLGVGRLLSPLLLRLSVGCLRLPLLGIVLLAVGIGLSPLLLGLSVGCLLSVGRLLLRLSELVLLGLLSPLLLRLLSPLLLGLSVGCLLSPLLLGLPVRSLLGLSIGGLLLRLSELVLLGLSVCLLVRLLGLSLLGIGLLSVGCLGLSPLLLGIGLLSVGRLGLRPLLLRLAVGSLRLSLLDIGLLSVGCLGLSPLLLRLSVGCLRLSLLRAGLGRGGLGLGGSWLRSLRLSLRSALRLGGILRLDWLGLAGVRAGFDGFHIACIGHVIPPEEKAGREFSWLEFVLERYTDPRCGRGARFGNPQAFLMTEDSCARLKPCLAKSLRWYSCVKQTILQAPVQRALDAVVPEARLAPGACAARQCGRSLKQRTGSWALPGWTLAGMLGGVLSPGPGGAS